MRKRLATLTAAAVLAAGFGVTAAHALPKQGTGVKAPPDRVVVDPPVDPGNGGSGTVVVVDCYDPVEGHLAPCPTKEPEGGTDDHGMHGHDESARPTRTTGAPRVVVTPTFAG